MDVHARLRDRASRRGNQDILSFKYMPGNACGALVGKIL
jgi:hypothetical protein